MKRILGYVRVSTEEQALYGLSIEAQTNALNQWAEEHGEKIVHVYTDAGISARKPASKRPELQKLLTDVKSRKCDLIIFTKLDRWFRNIAEYYKVQEILEKNNVDWKTIQEDYDTSTAAGRLKINIMLSVAQDEADRTSERIKAVNEMKRQKLQPLTGESPFGYKIENKKFVKDPEKAEAISAFFERFLATGSMSEARTFVLDYYGMRLDYQKAHKILNMPCYYGHYFGVDGMTPPYISKEEYKKIQSMRRHLVRKAEKNRIYLFSGLIFCGECKSRMGSRVNTNGEIFFYNCTTHYMKLSGCNNKVNLSEKKIEAYLIETIQDKLEQWEVEAEKIEAVKKVRDYKTEISVLRSKLGKLKDLYLNDIITLEECKHEQEEYIKKIEALEAEADMHEAPSLETARRLLSEDWKTSYGFLEKEKKREFWRMLIKEIRIYADRHIEYDLLT